MSRHAGRSDPIGGERGTKGHKKDDQRGRKRSGDSVRGMFQTAVDQRKMGISRPCLSFGAAAKDQVTTLSVIPPHLSADDSYMQCRPPLEYGIDRSLATCTYYAPHVCLLYPLGADNARRGSFT